MSRNLYDAIHLVNSAATACLSEGRMEGVRRLMHIRATLLSQLVDDAKARALFDSLPDRIVTVQAADAQQARRGLQFYDLFLVALFLIASVAFFL